MPACFATAPRRKWAIVATCAKAGLSAGNARKLDEIPYDFSRRRLSIVVEEAGKRRLITKGAFADVMALCTEARIDRAVGPLEPPLRATIKALFQAQGEAGFRTLAVAERDVETAARYQMLGIVADVEQALTH